MGILNGNEQLLKDKLQTATEGLKPIYGGFGAESVDITPTFEQRNANVVIENPLDNNFRNNLDLAVYWTGKKQDGVTPRHIEYEFSFDTATAASELAQRYATPEDLVHFASEVVGLNSQLVNTRIASEKRMLGKSQRVVAMAINQVDDSIRKAFLRDLCIKKDENGQVVAVDPMTYLKPVTKDKQLPTMKLGL